MSLADLEKELEKKIKAIEIGNPEENIRERCLYMALNSGREAVVDTAEEFYQYIKNGRNANA